MLTTLIDKGAARLSSNRSPPKAALSRLRKGRNSIKRPVCRRQDVLKINN